MKKNMEIERLAQDVFDAMRREADISYAGDLEKVSCIKYTNNKGNHVKEFGDTMDITVFKSRVDIVITNKDNEVIEKLVINNRGHYPRGRILNCEYSYDDGDEKHSYKTATGLSDAGSEEFINDRIFSIYNDIPYFELKFISEIGIGRVRGALKTHEIMRADKPRRSRPSATEITNNRLF
jgi:hypothetical protein